MLNPALVTSESKAPKKTVDQVRYALMSALINLDNLGKAVPALKRDPYFKIVRYQMQCALVDDESTIPELK